MVFRARGRLGRQQKCRVGANHCCPHDPSTSKGHFCWHTWLVRRQQQRENLPIPESSAMFLETDSEISNWLICLNRGDLAPKRQTFVT